MLEKNMRIKAIAIALTGIIMSGCVSTQPPKPPKTLALDPFTVKLPKSMDFSRGNSWGIKFDSDYNYEIFETLERFEEYNTLTDFETKSVNTDVCKGRKKEAMELYISLALNTLQPQLLKKRQIT